MEQLKRFTNTKWVSTVASIWIQCTSGSLYTFSIYSPILKSSQGYTQSTLDSVSVFKDIGANSGVLAGILYSSPGGGPWAVHLVGAALSFCGYFLMWAAVDGLISRPPVPVMCLFMFVTAHAQSFFNTSNVVTSVRNFGRYSGTAVGIMKGFVGLSGAILIQVYQTMFEDRPTRFLLMLALLPTINPLLLMWLVRIYDTDEVGEMRHLNGFSLIAMVVAAYLMVIIILENILTFNLSAHIVSFVVLMFLLASPLVIATKVYCKRSHKEDGSASGLEWQEASENTARQRLSGYHALPSHDDQGTRTDGDTVFGCRENVNLLQAMCTVNFWFLFLAMACGMGSGLATVNNIGQIGRSYGYKSSETDTLVSLWSIWNFLGRFGGGYVSDYFLHKRGWPRPLFMAITLAIMSAGHAVIASGLPSALYIGSVLVGVCYGSQWSLMPTITSEIYGVAHMGTIFNAITVANPVGSYIFSVRVIGYIYDKEASGEGNVCSGTHCFLLSFIIMASATFLGSLLAFGLYFRTRQYYSQVILRKVKCSAM